MPGLCHPELVDQQPTDSTVEESETVEREAGEEREAVEEREAAEREAAEEAETSSLRVTVPDVVTLRRSERSSRAPIRYGWE